MAKTNKQGGEQAPLAKAAKYIVTSEFRDANNFEIVYKVGDDVSHFDATRLKSLVERQLAELK